MKRSVMSININSRVVVFNASRTCEPSGFLFNRALMFLRANGYSLVFDAARAGDVALINACCVTREKMDEARAFVSSALADKNMRCVVLFGCFMPLAPVASEDGRLVCVGAKEMDALERYFPHQIALKDVPSPGLDGDSFLAYQSRMTATDRFVMISQGCAHGCSYCNTRKAKGYVCSRPPEDIIRDVENEVRQGGREVVLLSDDGGSYGRDIGTDLAVLINAVCAAVPGVVLKISSFYPGDLLKLYAGLKEVIAAGRISYMSVPLQSASPRVLKLMHRDYDVKAVADIVRDMKRLSPSLWLYTHILINFPTETLDDLRVSLKAALLFNEYLVISYSDNPGTPASHLVPKVDRAERCKRLAVARQMVARAGRGIVVGA